MGRSPISIVFVVMLAAGLPATAYVALRNAEAHGLAGLHTRLADRALRIQAGIRGWGPISSADLEARLREAAPTGGSVHIVSPDGAIVASSHQDAAPMNDEPTPPPAGETRFRRVAGDVDRAEVWLFPERRPRGGGPPPGRRRPGPGQGPPRGGPGRGGPPDHALAGGRRLVVGVDIARALPGVTTARGLLALSGGAALLLLLLGLGAIRLERRAAALALQIERRRHLTTLGELGAVLAHEIRTPLATVRGFAQLLGERVDPSDTHLAQPAARIVAETDRLGRLVQDLLGYARPAPPQIAETDVAALLAVGVERWVLLAAQREVLLMCDAPERLLAPVDGDRLLQALDNLVHNAVEVTPAGAPVLVRLERRRGEARFEVLDRGPGVPDDLKQRIFEPFQTTRARGTGLGLAVARRIAAEHGGTLEVSDREGGGAIFTLRVPL